MAVQCITSTRFTMLVDVLRQSAIPQDNNVALSAEGTHSVRQDPRSGAIVRDWKPILDDVSNPVEPSAYSFSADVRGIADGGIRVAGTTERWDKIYENVDFVHMKFPAKYTLTKRDRITNVRNKQYGNIIWVEEELDKENGLYLPTVFDVLGVQPVTNPFGVHIENSALLARTDVNA